MPVPAWQTIARAVPLAATEQLGLGPYRQPGRRDPARLATLASSADVRYTAVDTAGATGNRLLVVLAWYGGELDAEPPTRWARCASSSGKVVPVPSTRHAGEHSVVAAGGAP